MDINVGKVLNVIVTALVISILSATVGWEPELGLFHFLILIAIFIYIDESRKKDV